LSYTSLLCSPWYQPSLAKKDIICVEKKRKGREHLFLLIDEYEKGNKQKRKKENTRISTRRGKRIRKQEILVDAFDVETDSVGDVSYCTYMRKHTTGRKKEKERNEEGEYGVLIKLILLKQ
jgi:hypothetical protein